MKETIATTIALIKQRMNRFREDLEDRVTKQEFYPVQKIVYGIVGLALTSLAVAIFNMVIKQ